MKVLHLISSGGMYGAEAVVGTLARDMQRMGEGSIVGMFDNAHRPKNDAADRMEESGVKVIRIPCGGRVDPRTVRAIHKILISDDISLLHCHGYKADIYGYLATRKLRLPKVATRHSQIAKHCGLAVRAYEFLDLRFLRHFDAVIAVSESIAEETRQIGIAPQKIFTIPNGINPLPFGPVAPKKKSSTRSKIRIGTVGRLIDRKGIDYFLQAARLIHIEFPQAHFVIVGDGPYRGTLERLARDLGIERNVSFDGTRTDMPNVYNSFDIFVLPSLEEGLPLTVLEALASQCPVVATAVGAIPEVIVTGQTGILIRPGEIDELAGAIRSLLVDSELRWRLGENGLALIHEHYSCKIMSESYLKIYNGLITWNQRTRNSASSVVRV
jgi:glycosyltransferase involved in cell wall biosynthesis